MKSTDILATLNYLKRGRNFGMLGTAIQDHMPTLRVGEHIAEKGEPRKFAVDKKTAAVVVVKYEGPGERMWGACSVDQSMSGLDSFPVLRQNPIGSDVVINITLVWWMGRKKKKILIERVRSDARHFSVKPSMNVRRRTRRNLSLF